MRMSFRIPGIGHNRLSDAERKTTEYPGHACNASRANYYLPGKAGLRPPHCGRLFRAAVGLAAVKGPNALS